MNVLLILFLLVFGGFSWSYSLVWFNEESLLVLSFLIFCVLVNYLLKYSFVEFVLSRNMQFKEHAFVFAKRYAFRDLRKQKLLQQYLVVSVSQAAKIVLEGSHKELCSMYDNVISWKIDVADSILRTEVSLEQQYVLALVNGSTDMIKNNLSVRLLGNSNDFMKNHLFKMDFEISKEVVDERLVVLALLLCK